MNRNFRNLRIAPDAVEPITVEFGEWLPDLPEVDNPGALEALNVIPSEGCYIPFKDIVPVTAMTLPAAVRGAIQVLDRDGHPVMYVGTDNALYASVGTSFESRYTPDIAPLYAENHWHFIQYGYSIVAVHSQQRPLVADVGGVDPFAPLAGAPPIAACGARVGDFLVLGNLDAEADADDPHQPSRIRWSGFNNIEAPWITDPATQADFNDMPAEGGGVTAIVGRENGTIFQERSISRLTYVGPPTVFDVDTVEESRGAISVGSVVDIGQFVFFIAEDGFHIWNGTNTSPIADNKVNRYFFSRLVYPLRNRIVGAVDFFNKCVVWAFPTANLGVLDELIIYSYKENRWSHSDKVVDWILSGYTLDASIDELLGNLDTGYTTSFDDPSYMGRRPYLAGFNSSHTFGLFNGSNRAVVLDTSEYTGPNGRRVFANSARPVVDVGAAVATIQTAGRDQFRGEALSFGLATAQELTGECPVLVDARYVRFRMALPAASTWTKARGVELWRKATGRR